MFSDFWELSMCTENKQNFWSLSFLTSKFPFILNSPHDAYTCQNKKFEMLLELSIWLCYSLVLVKDDWNESTLQREMFLTVNLLTFLFIHISDLKERLLAHKTIICQTSQKTFMRRSPLWRLNIVWMKTGDVGPFIKTDDLTDVNQTWNEWILNWAAIAPGPSSNNIGTWIIIIFS